MTPERSDGDLEISRARAPGHSGRDGVPFAPERRRRRRFPRRTESRRLPRGSVSRLAGTHARPSGYSSISAATMHSAGRASSHLKVRRGPPRRAWRPSLDACRCDSALIRTRRRKRAARSARASARPLRPRGWRRRRRRSVGLGMPFRACSGRGRPRRGRPF